MRDSPPVYEQKGVILSTWCKIDKLNVSTVTWHFELVLNWIWPCCISTHLTFQVSQGSAATDLRWGEKFNTFLFRNSLLYIAVKKLRKSVNTCLSYHKNKSVSFFYGPQCSLRYCCCWGLCVLFWISMQQGKMFFVIGIVMILVQGKSISQRLIVLSFSSLKSMPVFLLLIRLTLCHMTSHWCNIGFVTLCWTAYCVFIAIYHGNCCLTCMRPMVQLTPIVN